MSTDESGAERRRVPRLPLAAPVECQLDVQARVRLVDISLSGAMVASEVPLPVGSSAQLKIGLAPGPFVPDVQVRRGTQRARDAAVSLGVLFAGMDDRSRQSLEQFLKKASD